MMLPSYFYFTDDKRGKDPLYMAAHLRADTGLLFRHYDHPNRAALCRQIARISKKRGLTLFVAKNARLAAQVGADGCHLPAFMMGQIPRLKSAHPHLKISVACHSIADLYRAQTLGADMAYLSPLYPTRSHPGQRVLPPLALAAYIRRLKIPVYGLGGVDWRRSQQLEALGFSGFGAISLFETDT